VEAGQDGVGDAGELVDLLGGEGVDDIRAHVGDVADGGGLDLLPAGVGEPDVAGPEVVWWGGAFRQPAVLEAANDVGQPRQRRVGLQGQRAHPADPPRGLGQHGEHVVLEAVGSGLVTLAMSISGRDELEWNALVGEASRHLKQQARLERTTSYTELSEVLHSRTGFPPFDFGTDGGRAAMGDLLGEVARANVQEVGALLSSIVVYVNGNDAGAGFYRLAADLGMLSTTAKSDERFTFCVSQVKAVHE